MRDVLLFHWSPTERRRSILRSGLVPHSRSLDGEWRPPHVCLAASPSLAWALSGALHPEYESWDLWQVWSSRLGRARRRWEDGRVLEVRALERIYKRDVWYVATRIAA